MQYPVEVSQGSEPVTLCIAAESEFEGESAIALCCDWQAQKGVASVQLVNVDDVFKIRHVGAASALLAGSESAAKDLLTSCRGAIAKFCGAPYVEGDSDLVIDTFLSDLRKAAESRKRDIIEHHVTMQLGITYTEFRGIGADARTLGQESVSNEIRALTLGADLIICGFHGKEPVIVRLDRNGQTHWETYYSLIGEGALIAFSFLCQQPWISNAGPNTLGTRDTVPLLECLYRVYEAKRASEKNSSVGQATAMQVVLQSQGVCNVNPRFVELLEDKFREKHKVPKIEWDSSSLLESPVPFRY